MPIDYDRVRLTWNPPKAAYERGRLIKSRYGFPQHHEDGEALFDSSFVPTSFEDTEVYGGSYYFYGLFLRIDATTWIRAGVSSTLMVRDQGFGQQMYDVLPNYHKYGSRELTFGEDDNPQLVSFMKVFGWGADQVKTYYDYLGRLHDTNNLSVPHLKALSEQLGIEFEEAISLRQSRQRVRYHSVITRQKGTTEGLRNLINAATGWDVDITVGNNLLLDNDQSSFVHPVYENWSPLINYAEGERVRYNHWVYEATANGAYGETQAPTGVRSSSNTWWTYLGDRDSGYPAWSSATTYKAGMRVQFNDRVYRALQGNSNQAPSGTEVDTVYWIYLSDTLKNVKTGGINTWEAYALDGSADAVSAVRLNSGVESPSDPDARVVNALYLVNNTAATKDFAFRSVARLVNSTSMDPARPILDGIPVPQAYEKYDERTTYLPGALVRYQGRSYRARRESTGAIPPAGLNYDVPTPEWEAVGLDRRLRLALSAYLAPRQPAGTFTSWTPPKVYPFIEWYDSNGKLISTVMSNDLRTNHLANGDYELALTADTTAYNSATISRNTTTFHDGVASLQVSTNSATSKQGFVHSSATTFAANSKFFASGFIKGTKGTVIEVAAQILDAGTNALLNERYISTYTLSGHWDYVRTPQFTHRTTFKAALRISLKTAASGVTFYADDVQLSVMPLPAIDTFGDGTNWDDKPLDQGHSQWVENAGQWVSSGFANGVAVPTTTGQSIATVASDSNAVVAVTFRTSPATGMVQGLVFRYQDNSNYWRATRTQLQVKVTGAVAQSWNYATGFSDNDRMKVSFSGDNITVFRNNVQVLAVTDSRLNTAARAGMVVE